MRLYQFSLFSSLNVDPAYRHDFEDPVDYCQTFSIEDIITLQALATSANPDIIPEFHLTGNSTVSLTPTVYPSDKDGYSILYVDVSSMVNAPGNYLLSVYDRENLLHIENFYFRVLSETDEELNDTVRIRYSHNINEFNARFINDSTPLYSDIRIEGAFRRYAETHNNQTDYFRDQDYYPNQLSSYAYTARTLSMGDSAGLPGWIGEKLNYIFSLSDVTITTNGEERSYVRHDGAQVTVETIETDKYPMYIYSVEVEKKVDRFGIYPFEYNKEFKYVGAPHNIYDIGYNGSVYIITVSNTISPYVYRSNDVRIWSNLGEITYSGFGRPLCSPDGTITIIPRDATTSATRYFPYSTDNFETWLNKPVANLSGFIYVALELGGIVTYKHYNAQIRSWIPPNNAVYTINNSATVTNAQGGCVGPSSGNIRSFFNVGTASDSNYIAIQYISMSISGNSVTDGSVVRIVYDNTLSNGTQFTTSFPAYCPINNSLLVIASRSQSTTGMPLYFISNINLTDPDQNTLVSGWLPALVSGSTVIGLVYTTDYIAWAAITKGAASNTGTILQYASMNTNGSVTWTQYQNTELDKCQCRNIRYLSDGYVYVIGEEINVPEGRNGFLFRVRPDGTGGERIAMQGADEQSSTDINLPDGDYTLTRDGDKYYILNQ